MEQGSATKATKALQAGLFLIGAAVILFEIALMRVFAVMTWHHLTYMVVAVAMLGFGAAGSLLAIVGRRPRDPAARLSMLALVFAITMPTAIYFGSVVELDSLRLLDDPRNVAALLLLYLVVSMPFVFGGLVVGTLLQVHAESVHRLYFADLVGSALGAAAAIALLDALGAVAVVHLAGALAALGAFLFALGAGRFARGASLATTLVIATLTLGYAGGFASARLPALDWPLRIAPGKELAGATPPGIERRLPSATAEVEIARERMMAPMMGGEFPLVGVPAVPGKLVGQDGTAPTMLYAGAAELDRFPFLDRSQAASGYVALAAAGRETPDVLVVGVGGGVDVMVALARRARSVTAVEINRAMIRMLEEEDDYLGGLFSREDAPFDRVRLVPGEGRAFVRHSARRWDLIQLSGVDSYTALATGAYTLSESYLYTVEAVRDFLDHLNEGGIVVYSRFILSRPRRPRETPRLAAIARQALLEEGVADPTAAICVLQGRLWASTMIKKGAFTPAEIAALRRFAAANDFRGLVFDPLADAAAGFPDEPAPLAALALYFRDRLRAEVGSLLPAPTDERLGLLAARFALAGRGAAAPTEAELEEVLDSVPETSREPVRGMMATFLDQARAEVDADVEHFRGVRRDFARLLSRDDEERRSFVASYPYRLDPCRDDAPFFFDYQRWGDLRDGFRGETSLYHPDFPVGHGVLLASLVQALALALLMVVLPLRAIRDRGRRSAGRLRYLAYFAALGLAFMMVEIAAMQKLVLLLGHPSHALAVVLGGLLFFAGLGSLLAERLDRAGPIVILLLGFFTALAVMGLNEAIRAFAPRLLGTSFAVRVAASLALVAPAALLMGAAFPLGIRSLRARAPALIPWAWGVNGFTSVMGGILAIVLAQQIGFERVLYGAAAIYVLGFLLLPPEPAESAAPHDDEAGEADEGHRE